MDFLILRSFLIFANSFIIAVTQQYQGHVESCSVDSVNERLPINNVLPERYNLNLTVNLSYDKVIGNNTIVVKVVKSTRNISLHAYGLTILTNGIQLRNAYDNLEELYTFNSYHYCSESQILNLWFNEMINPGIYNLMIHFSAPYSDWKGMVKYQYGTGSTQIRLITTQTEPNGARRVFPCWDEPGIKAIFNIIITHPKNYKAYSNMPTMFRSCITADTKETFFAETFPISASYVSITLLQDNLQTSMLNPIDRLWSRPELVILKKEEAVGVIRTELMHWDFLNISKEKIPERNYIFFPNITSKSIGYVGLIIHREEDLTYDKDRDFPGRKLDIKELARHTIGRVLFMNLISMSWWTDLWLGEALAHYYRYYRYYITSFELSKSEDISIFNTVKSLQLILKYDVNDRMEAISSYNVQKADKIEEELLSSFYYVKGYLLMRMFGDVLLPSKFYHAVLQNLTTNHFRLATVDDFWDTLQHAYNEKGYKNVTIKEVMSTYLTERSYPVIKVEQGFRENALIYILQEKVNRSIEWQIPISYVKISDISMYNITNVIWLNYSQTVTISTINEKLNYNDLIIISRIQNAGYYRVNYDNNTWESIANYLSYHYQYFDVFTRAQFIDDAHYFMVKGHVKPFTFWRITKYLMYDTDYIAWYPMFNILENIGHYWHYPKALYIKKDMLDTFNGVLEILGYEEDSNDNGKRKALRLLVTRWACKFGHTKCRIAARAKLITHLNNPDQHKISPWWMEWTYCAGVMRVNQIIVNDFFRKYYATKNPYILKYMYCLEDENSIIEYIELLMLNINSRDEQDALIKKEFSKLFYAIVKKHARKDKVLQHILYRYLSIRNRLHSDNVDRDMLGTMIMNIFNFEKLNQFTLLKEFVALQKLLNINMSEVNFLINAQKERIRREITELYYYL